MTTTTCGWFAKCTRPAAGFVKHPVLGLVPVCDPCAQRFGLAFVPTTPSIGAQP